MKTIIISVCSAFLLITGVLWIVRCLLSAPLLNEGEEDWRDWREYHALD